MAGMWHKFPAQWALTEPHAASYGGQTLQMRTLYGKYSEVLSVNTKWVPMIITRSRCGALPGVVQFVFIHKTHIHVVLNIEK